MTADGVDVQKLAPSLLCPTTACTRLHVKSDDCVKTFVHKSSGVASQIRGKAAGATPLSASTLCHYILTSVHIIIY